MALPGDQELLELIRQLYELNRAAWWARALELVMYATGAQGAWVAVDDDGPRERARVGKVPEIIDDFPESAGVKLEDDGARVRLSHEIFPRDTLWALFECSEDPRLRVRLATLVTHLQLACDFTIRKGDGEPLPNRLRGADGPRRVGVAEVLSRMTDRAMHCALLAARGYTNGQIGEYLDLNAASVARALQEVYRHFEISGRAELDVAALLALPKPPRVNAEKEP